MAESGVMISAGGHPDRPTREEMLELLSQRGDMQIVTRDSLLSRPNPFAGMALAAMTMDSMIPKYSFTKRAKPSGRNSCISAKERDKRSAKRKQAKKTQRKGRSQ